MFIPETEARGTYYAQQILAARGAFAALAHKICDPSLLDLYESSDDRAMHDALTTIRALVRKSLSSARGQSTRHPGSQRHLDVVKAYESKLAFVDASIKLFQINLELEGGDYGGILELTNHELMVTILGTRELFKMGPILW